ncbi:hypothetical protein BZZ01_14345 [Nostocales cyanobacterium HT-58-2]|nr:hypothetical protein BZZ01_14345 [Nostocales cyanobacterium HT-58-2]
MNVYEGVRIMKKTIQYIAIRFASTFLLVISIVFLTKSTLPAQAQEFPNTIDIQPRSSERFFKEGREAFEREIQNLIREKYIFSNELLKIDENLPTQIQKQLLNQESSIIRPGNTHPSQIIPKVEPKNTEL